jgi:hypothetical protein
MPSEFVSLRLSRAALHSLGFVGAFVRSPSQSSLTHLLGSACAKRYHTQNIVVKTPKVYPYVA